MPMPPARAIAIAIGASVTVSMFAETTGTARRRRVVSRVDTSTSDRDPMPLRRGDRRTSSYDRASGMPAEFTRRQ